MSEEKKIEDSVENIAGKLWQMYQDGLSYQSQIGLSKNIPMFIDFVEGRQWPAPTENTKNLPRPVINIIKMICRSKKSSIRSKPVRLVLKISGNDEKSEKFTRVANYLRKEVGQDALDDQAVDDGIKKGSYYYHYFWDTEAIGEYGIKDGAMRCEVIDILDIFFANPTEIDVQKQEWILIVSRESVKAVKQKADQDIDKDLICSDEGNKRYNEKEQEGTELCTVLTRYFRKNGEVYCEKATRGTVVNKAFPLTPDIDGAKRLVGIEEDAPNNSLPDIPESEININKRPKATLYPIVVGNYEKREKSIYGLSEVEGLIPNQKAINFNLAMYLLNIENLAWGKWKVTPDALNGQVIDNTPGQTLIDYSKGGNGISKLTAQELNSAPINVLERIMEYTRVVTGSTEVMTGEVISSNMSGAAIAQLQAQAQQPIEELQKSYWKAIEDQGKIYAQFIKLFYSQGKKFSYTDTVKETDKETGNLIEKEIEQVDEFNSDEFANEDFTVVVEATAGTKSSTAGDINLIETLFAKGVISKKTFIECYPENAISNKSELIKAIEKEDSEQMTILQNQVKDYENKLMQQSQLLEKQKQTVDNAVSIIKQYNSLESMFVNLYNEAKGKIQQSNEIIKKQNEKYAEVAGDAKMFAEEIARNKVIPGQ